METEYRVGAGGCADLTRIVSRSPRMGRKVGAGRRFETRPGGLRKLLEEQDRERLEERFRHAGRERDAYLEDPGTWRDGSSDGN